MKILTANCLSMMSWKQLSNALEVAFARAERKPTPENIKAVNDLSGELLVRLHSIHTATKVREDLYDRHEHT